jgi:hypothetical protein
MQLIADPFVFYGKFLFQLVDKTLADETKRSHEVGKDP